MQGNSKQKIYSLLFVVLALCVTTIIFTDRSGNAVANLGKYLTFGAPVVGFLAPRFSFWIFFGLAFYMNLIKRVMVFEGMGSIDLIYANAPPAMLLAGICLGSIVGLIKNGKLQEKKYIITIFIATFVFLVLAAITLLSSGEMSDKLSAVAGSAAYVFLAPMALIHIQSIEEILKYVKLLVLLFIPVLIWAMTQKFFGANTLDYIYGTSPWTIKRVPEDGIIIRCFGTFPSSEALGVTGSILAFLYIAKSKYIAFDQKFRLKSFLIWTVFLLLLSSVYFAGVRNVMLSSVATVVAYVLLRKRFLIMFGYCSLFILYGCLVQFSSPIVEWYDSNKSSVYSDTEDLAVSRMTNVSTLSGRLAGWNNMKTNSDLWAPFGVNLERGLDGRGHQNFEYWNQTDTRLKYSKEYVHDVFSAVIVKFGYVPFFVLVIGGGVFAWRLPSLLNSFILIKEKLLFRGCFACIAGGAGSFFGSFRTLTLFPGNAVLFLAVGLCLVVWFNRSKPSVVSNRL